MSFNKERDPRALEPVQDLVKEWERETEQRLPHSFIPPCTYHLLCARHCRGVEERRGGGGQMMEGAHTPEAGSERCCERLGSRWRETPVEGTLIKGLNCRERDSLTARG